MRAFRVPQDLLDVSIRVRTTCAARSRADPPVLIVFARIAESPPQISPPASSRKQLQTIHQGGQGKSLISKASRKNIQSAIRGSLQIPPTHNWTGREPRALHPAYHPSTLHFFQHQPHANPASISLSLPQPSLIATDPTRHRAAPIKRGRATTLGVRGCGCGGVGAWGFVGVV